MPLARRGLRTSRPSGPGHSLPHLVEPVQHDDDLDSCSELLAALGEDTDDAAVGQHVQLPARSLRVSLRTPTP
jgi:hypothetical protein